MQWEHLFPQEITDIQDTLQKPENRQQMAAVFHHQWLTWTLLANKCEWLHYLTNSLRFLHLSKVERTAYWWLLFLKLPNKARANNSTQVPSSSVGEQGCLAAHRLWPCILSHDQNGNVHAQLKGTGFSVGFSLSTTSLTEVQRDQQPDVSASSTNAEYSLFLSLCTHN